MIRTLLAALIVLAFVVSGNVISDGSHEQPAPPPRPAPTVSGSNTAPDSPPLPRLPKDPPRETAGCHPSYPSECLDPSASDYDCEEGSGDGPEYVSGPVEVDSDVDDPDPFDLDRDGDGTACDE
jgi:hypothetical protein